MKAGAGDGARRVRGLRAVGEGARHDPTPPVRIPGYDEVKDEMTQQAAVEGLERARRQWLGELRRGVYVDVRL